MSADRHVVCPACRAVNRLPGDREAGKGRCGSCKAQLFDGRPVDVDAAGFERHRRSNDIPVLVDVWAPWCGPCRVMGPNYEKAAAALEPDIRLLKLNADHEQRLAGELGVGGIPALLLMKGGKVVARTAGAMPAEGIVKWTRENMG